MENKHQETTKRTVKIVYDGEIRKYRNIESYKDLILSIARTLGYGVLNCRFIYTDDENDEITVSTEEDLQEAFNFFSPKPPRLTLVTYNEGGDVSLSNVKLGQSQESGSQDVSHEELNFSENEEKPKEHEINLPLQCEKEDRPRQVLSDTVDNMMKQMDIIQKTVVDNSQHDVHNTSDEKEDEKETLQTYLRRVDSRDSEGLSEIEEDRIQPVFTEVTEAKTVAKDEDEDQEDLPESAEQKQPIVEQSFSKSLENKIYDLVKQQVSL